MDDIDGTYAILAALFRQLEMDSTALEPHSRAEVQRWLASGALAWWDDLLGLDGALEQTVRARLAARQAERQGRRPDRETGQLAFGFAPDAWKACDA